MKHEYNEEAELRRYVWRNYFHALPERERALHHAATLELKARHARSEDVATRIRAMDGYFLDANVAAIAENGLRAFEQQCYERLLRDRADEIHINRCERCNRILASPIACACLWCSHHWYDRRPEMMALAASSIYPKTQ